MQADKSKIWLELVSRHEELEGTRFVRMAKRLSTSHYTMDRNFAELIGAMDVYKKDESLWGVTERKRLVTLLNEISRLAHNYLATIYSLLEHIHVFCKALKERDLTKKYGRGGEERTRLENNECFSFVNDLRGYTQHYSLPLVTAVTTFTRAGLEDPLAQYKTMIGLDKQELLKWSLKQPSKRYLEKLSEKDIDFEVVVREYQRLISDFYNGFYAKAIQLRSNEIRELVELERQIEELENPN